MPLAADPEALIVEARGAAVGGLARARSYLRGLFIDSINAAEAAGGGAALGQPLFSVRT